MSRKPNGDGNGTPPPEDPEWDNLGSRIADFMSQQYRHPGSQPDEEDQPLPDPRLATDFRAVWDELALNPATARITAYINGDNTRPIPSLREIVRAFYAAGNNPPRAIFPQQISAVIAYCGGQLSNHISLRDDVLAEWAKARQDETDGAQAKQDTHNASGVPLAQSVPAFLKGSLQPTYLVEPVLQRSTLYTCTALTSHGKTATLLYIALCIASGRSVAGHYTTPGRVVWLAGENPDDFAAKIVTACDHWGIDPERLDMVVIPGAFDLAAKMDEAVRMAAAGGDTAMVVVDTSAAYRVDDGEDDNANSLAWARTMRGFVRMPGRPAVILATHPTKYAEPSNLLPRGGSGFLNEVDGNMSLWADEEQDRTVLHWCGKWRGMTFSPIEFELRPCPHPTWRLRNGEPVTIKLAIPTGADVPRPTASAPTRGGRPPGNDVKTRLARDILADVLVTEGRAGFAPQGLLAVMQERWREEYYRRGCLDDDLAATKQKAFKRAVDRLVETKAIGIADKWVWLAQPGVD